MHDRPTAAELVAATRQYLESELIPTLSDARLRFQTLVAANVLSIVERELLVEERHLVEELQGPRPESLAALRQAVRDENEALCARIRNGEFDEPERFRELLSQLRRGVERKLEVANPRYLASSRAIA